MLIAASRIRLVQAILVEEEGDPVWRWAAHLYRATPELIAHACRALSVACHVAGPEESMVLAEPPVSKYYHLATAACPELRDFFQDRDGWKK